MFNLLQRKWAQIYQQHYEFTQETQNLPYFKKQKLAYAETFDWPPKYCDDRDPAQISYSHINNIYNTHPPIISKMSLSNTENTEKTTAIRCDWKLVRKALFPPPSLGRAGGGVVNHQLLAYKSQPIQPSATQPHHPYSITSSSSSFFLSYSFIAHPIVRWNRVIV